MLVRLNEIDTALQVISKLRAEYESVLTCFAKDGPTQEDLRFALLGVRRIEALDRPIPDLSRINTHLMLTLEDILQNDMGDALPDVEEGFWEFIPDYVEPVVFPGLVEDPFDEDE